MAHPPPESDPRARFSGGGQMGERIRGHDWASTPLGPIAQWPPELTTLVSVALASAQPMFIAWGPERTLLYNDGYAEMLQDRHPEALGRPFPQVWWDIFDDIRPIMDRAFAGESTFMDDIEFQMTRGGRRQETHFSFCYTPVRDASGAVVGMVCPCAETTEQVRRDREERQAETDLRLRFAEDVQRLQSLFEQAPGLIAVLRGPGHVFELVNQAYRELVGPGRELIGQPVREALPETVGQGFIELLDQVYASGKSVSGHASRVLLRRGAGGLEESFVDFIYQPIVGSSGAVEGIFVEGYDVTAHQRALEQLRETSEQLRLIVESATEFAIITTCLEGKVTLWSPGAEQLIGWSAEEMLGQPADRMFTPDDLEAGHVQTEMDVAKRAGRASDERWHMRRDGSRFWASGVMMPLRGSEGQPVGYLKIMRDRTLQRRAEEVLRSREAQFRTIAESIPQLAWMAHPDGSIVWFNRRWYEYTGQTPEQARGFGWKQVQHPAHAGRVQEEFLRCLAQGADWEDTFPMRGRDGRYRWFLSRATAIRDGAGNIVSWFGTNTDITEQREAEAVLERRVQERTAELAASNRQLLAQIEEREKAEASLRQLQRLEAVGQLTSGVAHDFNNLLQVIVGNIGILRILFRQLAVEDKYRQRLDSMGKAADRGAKLTAQLLAFSRRQRLEPKPTDLNQTVEGMVDLLRSSIGGTVKLEMHLQPELWHALIDPTQIELVILNLAVNARDAMDVGGTLVVRTANALVSDPPARPEEPAPGEYVLLAVCDTGEGMAEEVRAKVFEPFFTTKEVGKGSGLGLSQVLGFAKQSGGGVRIITAPGAGTTVEVYLPRAAADQEEYADGRGPDEAAPRGAAAEPRCVLLVDDDDAVREVTAAMLAGSGFDVLEAGSGGAALEVLSSARDRIDLLVVDFAMPGMNGAEVAREARARKPGLPVLFVTGYVEHGGLDAGTERVIEKPFSADALVEAARAALRE